MGVYHHSTRLEWVYTIIPNKNTKSLKTKRREPTHYQVFSDSTEFFDRGVNIMSLLKEVPKELEKDEFDTFKEKILTNHPASEFPEIFIYYQEVEDKILVLGLGDISECAEQAYQFLKGNPELRKRKSDVDMLRVSRTRFLLR